MITPHCTTAIWVGHGFGACRTATRLEPMPMHSPVCSPPSTVQALPSPSMPEEDKDFLINYKGKPINVSPVLNGGNIFFIVHLPSDVVIAETMVDDQWIWFQPGKGQTPLAAELGAILENMEI